MQVEVVSASLSSVREADYVRVEVRPDPERDTTLATIERIVRRNAVKPAAPVQRVKKLIDGQPMSYDDAVSFATSYAASKKIRLVLTAADSAASA